MALYSVWGYENADLGMMKNLQFVTLTGKNSQNPKCHWRQDLTTSCINVPRVDLGKACISINFDMKYI